jgi:uncharacterized membrane protein
MAGQSSAHPAPKSRVEILVHKVGAFALEYWALVITTFFGLIVLAALSAPILTYFGLDSIAKPIFYGLHLICGQIPSHSFYIEGHQVGLCVHCLAIYSSMFGYGLTFGLGKKRLPGLPWWILVLTSLPLAYDGFTQMFGLRQSTWEIRLITGALFGLGAMWFALPLIQKTLKEMTPAGL